MNDFATLPAIIPSSTNEFVGLASANEFVGLASANEFVGLASANEFVGLASIFLEFFIPFPPSGA